MVVARRAALALGIGAVLTGIGALSTATATYVSLIVGGALLAVVAGGFEIRSHRRKLANMKGKGRGGKGKGGGTGPRFTAIQVENSQDVQVFGNTINQTAYVGTPARTLAGIDTSPLVEAMRPFAGGTRVRLGSESRAEPHAFADELFAVLFRAGWDTSWRASGITIPPAAAGVSLSFPGEVSDAPPWVMPLANWLASHHFRVVVLYDVPTVEIHVGELAT